MAQQISINLGEPAASSKVVDLVQTFHVLAVLEHTTQTANITAPNNVRAVSEEQIEALQSGKSLDEKLYPATAKRHAEEQIKTELGIDPSIRIVIMTPEEVAGRLASAKSYQAEPMRFEDSQNVYAKIMFQKRNTTDSKKEQWIVKLPRAEMKALDKSQPLRITIKGSNSTVEQASNKIVLGSGKGLTGDDKHGSNLTKGGR